MLNNRLTTGFVLLSSIVVAQQNGRFATLKNQAFELFDRGRYDQVSGRLEEVWEQDRSDTKVAEYLAMGYLYGDHSVAKARDVMRASLEGGGRATFLVHHSHEKLGALNGDTINNYCNGRISVVPGKIIFTADSGEHSTSFGSEDLKEFRVLGGSPGRVQIKSGGKTYLFRVKSEMNDEAALFQEMAEQNLKKKQE
jgi:hypothetical protein